MTRKKTPLLSASKPLFWPDRRQWPPSNDQGIDYIIPDLPPIYVLTNGTKVKGEWRVKKTTKKKQSDK